MRCSSCKPLLGRYFEGTLGPQAAAVAAHLEGCAACATLLDELKVVDGLLATVRSPLPAPNFTFAVMAEVRSLPLPIVPRTHMGALLGGYVVIAWAIIALWMHLAGVTAQSALPNAADAFSQAVNTAHALAGGAMSSFGHGAPLVTTFVLGALALDVCVAAGVYILYVIVRPRLAAQLAGVPEVS
ncbi:MAG: hypothetical protein NVS9B12_09820 [Vulcanimicrobiaceae bacterium]